MTHTHIDDIVTERGVVRLRPMASRDLDRIIELEVTLFDASAWSYGAFAQELATHGRWYIVAEHDVKDVAGGDTVVGYAGLWFDGDVAQIMTIGVDPAAQGLHIGAALLDALIDRARHLGAHAVLLEVAVTNDRAIELYTRRGFHTITTRKRYYQPGNIDAYVMQRPLTDHTSHPGPVGREAITMEDPQ